MGRFNPNQYDAKQDSTPAVERAAKGTVTLLRDAGKCPCGCNQAPAGKRSQFRMGHDARLRGVLIRAHLTGTPVAYTDKPTGKRKVLTSSAMVWASEHGWEDYLDEAQERLGGKVAAARSSKGPKVGSTKQIQVGRWFYEGTVTKVSGSSVTYRYQPKSGPAKTVTLES